MSSVGIAEDRPPYVVFETRSMEDRQASIEAGHYTTKDVAFAVITPQGSKDRIERVAEEWFAQLAQMVREERFKPGWLKAYREAFDEWRSGQAPQLNGTDVRNWPAIGPSQVKLLRDLRLLTVEDVANMNEESISRLGMGGRALKTKAEEWLKAAQGVGKVSEELAALKTVNAELKTSNEKLAAQVAELLAAAKIPKTNTPL